MRTLLFALVLATSAAAQPVIGPEVSSPMIADLTDHTLAPLRDGYLLAWAQHGHLLATHLDSNLQVKGTPLDIPLSNPSAYVQSLVVATNGASALIAWNEDSVPSKVTYAVTLRTEDLALLAGPIAISYSAPPAVAGLHDGKFEIATGNRLLVLSDRLTTESVAIVDPFLSGAIASSGDLGSATFSKANLGCGSGFFALCTVRNTFTFSSPQYQRSFDYTAPLQSSASPLLRDPLVAADGDHFVGLLADKNQTHVVEVAATIPKGEWVLPALANAQLIAIAGNGKDVLLVSGNAALDGQLLELYDTVSPRFVIASGSVGAPKVFATSSSEFVVTYTREVPGGVVLAGRKIQLQRGKQRGVK